MTTEYEFAQRTRLATLIRYVLDQMGMGGPFRSEEMAAEMYRHGARVPDLLSLEIGRHILARQRSSDD